MITSQIISPIIEILILDDSLDGPNLAATLDIQPTTRHLICDLRRVRHISHEGFVWLVDQHMALQHLGGDLRLVGPAEQLGGYLGVNDLASLFQWCPDLAGALEGLQHPPLAATLHLGR